MRHSPARPITEILIDGLVASHDRFDAISDELQTAIAAAIGDDGHVSIDNIFYQASLPGKNAERLRRLRANPALYVEAPISQLRRAQAAFVRAHDDYLRGYSEIRHTELRWAELRVRIAQDQFDAIVHAHPAAPKPPKLAPVGRAARPIRLNDLSASEQLAVRGFFNDPGKAVEQLEGIIKRGEASGDPVRTLYAYMLDPKKTEDLNKWLTAELRESFDKTADAAASTAEPDTRLSDDGSALDTRASEEPTRGHVVQRGVWPPDAETVRTRQSMADELLKALEQMPAGLRAMLVEDAFGRIRLTEAPHAAIWKGRFVAAIDHPDVQSRLRALLPSQAGAV